MLESAVLVDTVVVDAPSSRMDKTATFIHNMYCPVTVNGEKSIAKLYITENIGDEHKFYLTKIEMESTDSVGANVHMSSADSTISIAEIFEFVKRNNEKFEANSENPSKFRPKSVNPLLLNKDGTPRVFHHGTALENGDFTVFDETKAKRMLGLGMRAWGKGNYFTSQNLSGSERYGRGRIIDAYLRLNQPIILDGKSYQDVVNRILNDDIVKIPKILNNPVLILKSRNVLRGSKNNSRLVLFGSVKAKNGQPIMAILDLRPIENGFAVDDMQKINSAYTKTNNPVDFIRNSEVLYADKKRTTRLLRTVGFHMPIELRLSGSIGSISYKGQNVNIFGEDFSKVFVESDTLSPKYSIAPGESESQRDYDKPITISDVLRLREIIKAHGGERVSINDFTSEDIQKAQKWAYKFYKDLGTKSPFFRAWFGDWRMYEQSPILKTPNVRLIHSFKSTKEASDYFKRGIKERTLFRGDTKNRDTNFTINIGAQVYNDTLSYASRELSRNIKKSSTEALDKYNDRLSILEEIKEICESSILLDTVVSKSDDFNDQSFVHIFYTTVELEGRKYLVRLTVDELNSLHGDIRRAYNLNAIEITPVAVSQVYKPAGTTDVTGNNVSSNSISQLYSLVKTYDKDFHAGKEVSSKLLDKNGKPRVFYHGTNADFTVINTNTEYNLPLFTTTDRYSAGTFGKNIIEFYGKAENILVKDNNGKAMHTAFYTYKSKRVSANELLRMAKADGYDAVVFRNAKDSADGTGKAADVYVFMKPEMQLKSATDNIGTFDGVNKDITYSIAPISPREMLHNEIAGLSDEEIKKRGLLTYRRNIDKYNDLRQQREEILDSINFWGRI